MIKKLSILFLIVFIFSVIGTAVFPSAVMVLCNAKSMCGITIHQIDKALGFFVGVFTYLVLLIVFSFIISVIPYSLKFVDLYFKRRLLRSPNNIFLDYIKKALSRGIIEPQLYY